MLDKQIEQNLAKAEAFLSGKATGLLVAVDNTNTLQHNQAVIYEIEKQIAMGESIPLHKAYNMLNLDALTLQHRKKLAEIFGMNATELKQAFAGFERSNAISAAIGAVPDNEYEFVDFLLKKWNTTMTFQKIYKIDTPYEFGGQTINTDDLETLDRETQVFLKGADPKRIAFGEMIAKVIKTNSTMDMGYNEAKVIRAVESWTYNEQNIIIATAKKDITFDKNCVVRAEVEWDNLVGAITDKNVAETKAVLKHFIWQIKRKMFGLAVEKHMMPVLVGLQEIGKSTIVKQIVAPIAEFSIITNFKDITDGRSHDLWKNYVLILDEMGNSTQSNIEEIKQKITGDVFNGRIMKTNNDTVIVNHTTMIGTSNKDLSRLIFDDTGMRRFFQITCKTAFDWNITNHIDYTLLWKSIDEEGKTALSDGEIAASVRVLQNEKRYQSLMELFFLERDYSGKDLYGKDRQSKDVFAEVILADDLYQEYREYEEKHMVKAEMSSQKFFRDMVDIPSRISTLTIEKLPRSKHGNRYRLIMNRE
jgi:hypothetical protein